MRWLFPPGDACNRVNHSCWPHSELAGPHDHVLIVTFAPAPPYPGWGRISLEVASDDVV
jgi:hypothetical protein